MTKPASRFAAAPLRRRRRALSHHPSCIGIPRVNISKHLAILVLFGLLQRSYGDLCRIPDCFLVPASAPSTSAPSSCASTGWMRSEVETRILFLLYCEQCKAAEQVSSEPDENFSPHPTIWRPSRFRLYTYDFVSLFEAGGFVGQQLHGRDP